MTSNSSISDKAIVGGTDYDSVLTTIELGQNRDVISLHEIFAIADTQAAVGILRLIYE